MTKKERRELAYAFVLEATAKEISEWWSLENDPAERRKLEDKILQRYRNRVRG